MKQETKTQSGQSEAGVIHKTYSQGSLVWPREPIAFGRIKAFPSESFWVTNSQLDQVNTGAVKIARSGRNAGHAVAITLEQANQFFTQPE